MKKHLIFVSSILSIGFLIGSSLHFAEAWINPITSAPRGNMSGPLNTVDVDQVKQASLGLTGNLSTGLIQLNTIVNEGSACSSNGLIGRTLSGAVLSCQSLVWKK
jgi:hypothetical protein